MITIQRLLDYVRDHNVPLDFEINIEDPVTGRVIYDDLDSIEFDIKDKTITIY